MSHFTLPPGFSPILKVTGVEVHATVTLTRRLQVGWFSGDYHQHLKLKRTERQHRNKHPSGPFLGAGIKEENGERSPFPLTNSIHGIHALGDL